MIDRLIWLAGTKAEQNRAPDLSAQTTLQTSVQTSA